MKLSGQEEGSFVTLLAQGGGPFACRTLGLFAHQTLLFAHLSFQFCDKVTCRGERAHFWQER